MIDNKIDVIPWSNNFICISLLIVCFAIFVFIIVLYIFDFLTFAVSFWGSKCCCLTYLVQNDNVWPGRSERNGFDNGSYLTPSKSTRSWRGVFVIWTYRWFCCRILVFQFIPVSAALSLFLLLSGATVKRYDLVLAQRHNSRQNNNITKLELTSLEIWATWTWLVEYWILDLIHFWQLPTTLNVSGKAPSESISCCSFAEISYQSNEEIRVSQSWSIRPDRANEEYFLGFHMINHKVIKYVT